MMRRTTFVLAAVMVLTLIGSSHPISLAAQDLQYTSTTKLEFGDRMGRVMRTLSRIAGASGETVETVYIKDNKMRTDQDESSMIIDLEGPRYIMIDHPNRFYSVMEMADMMQLAEQMSEQMEQAVAEARAEAADIPTSESTASVDFDIKVERTGETQTIRGHRAERFLMTLEARGSEMVVEDEQEEEVQGALVLATEMWMTNDRNGELAALIEFQERTASEMHGMAEDFATSAQAFGEGFQAAFASDPRMKEMLDRAAEEMAEMEGFTILTRMKMVIVPGDLPFDAAAAFAPEEAREEVSVGRTAGRMARGLLRNRLGGGTNDRAQDQAEQAPRQTTLMTITTEVTDVQRTTLAPELFDIPEGYSRRDLVDEMQ